MKKMNTKGFTLIELLAVITIMGILMMVAIPAVSRTIENSRRDTFVDVAQSYLNAVRNAVLADELVCNVDTTDPDFEVNVAATPDATYYFTIITDSTDTTGHYQQTIDLMESGGKSSWGNANVSGYVKWVRTTSSGGVTSATNTNTAYYVMLRDTAGHGTTGEIRDQEGKRTSIAVSGLSAETAPTGTAYECKLA